MLDQEHYTEADLVSIAITLTAGKNWYGLLVENKSAHLADYARCLLKKVYYGLSNGSWQTFETKGGLIGVGPRSVAEGDVICILFGADIPFVIRPQGAAAYSVVGECYIGPLMRGEAVQKLSSPGSGLENSWIELL